LSELLAQLETQVRLAILERTGTTGNNWINWFCCEQVLPENYWPKLAPPGTTGSTGLLASKVLSEIRLNWNTGTTGATGSQALLVSKVLSEILAQLETQVRLAILEPLEQRE